MSETSDQSHRRSQANAENIRRTGSEPQLPISSSLPPNRNHPPRSCFSPSPTVQTNTRSPVSSSLPHARSLHSIPSAGENGGDYAPKTPLEPVGGDVLSALQEAMSDMTMADEHTDPEEALWEKARLGKSRVIMHEFHRLLEATHQWVVEDMNHPINSKRKGGAMPMIRSCLEQMQDVLPLLNAKAVTLLAPAIALDVSPYLPGNGYRSLLSVLTSAFVHLNGRLNAFLLNVRKQTFYDFTDFAGYLDDYVHILTMIGQMMQIAVEIATLKGQSLFRSGCLDEVRSQALTMPLEHFYGARFGFQYPHKLQLVFRTILIAQASYHQGYKDGQTDVIQRAIGSLVSSVGILTDARKRAYVLMEQHRNANIAFVKSFWNLTETTPAKHAGKIFAPFVAINRQLHIPTEPVTLSVGHNRFKVVTPLVYLDDHISDYRGFLAAQEKNFKHPPADSLILHFHGGGFVAQSSMSHEIYLRTWAKNLGVPILSVDYSLAPKHPYPRALNECFHVYSWVLAHAPMLGCTGGRIILAGDSAGGNLCVAVAMKAAIEGVPQPSAILPCYPVLNIREDNSPARILSVMDPLLPFSVLLTCLDAYASPEQRAADDPLLSPFLAGDELLKTLGPIHLAACELDPLLDDSIMFARRLSALNIDFRFKVFEGMPHGFLSFAGHNEQARAGADFLENWLAELVGVQPKTPTLAIEPPSTSNLPPKAMTR